MCKRMGKSYIKHVKKMKSSKNKKNYNSKYFEERDYLDPRMSETIKILMKENKLHSVLDVGCGTGLLVKYLTKNKFKAIGCDYEKEAIKTALRINKINVVYGSATKLPFPKNSFDLVTSISVIEHLTPKEVKQFLNETKRVLKPNGYLFVVTPNYATPIRLLQGKKWFGYSDPTHINFYTPASFGNVLKKKGFGKIRTSFKSVYDLEFDWDLPTFFRRLPKPLVHFLTYLLVATPFSNIRNSFWIAAQKK